MIKHAAITLPVAPRDNRVRVMVCDDSLAIRGALTRLLEQDPGIAVVARVANGRAAIDEVTRQSIEVAVLDIEMPVMDGMTALPLLLRADPQLRVIMASTLTTRGADIAMQALRLGAADYIPKPGTAAIADESFASELIAKVKGLASLRRRIVAGSTSTLSTLLKPGVSTRATGRTALDGPSTSRPDGTAIALRGAPIHRPQLLAIGSSTGGPRALFNLVADLGKNLPVPVVLTQHMPRSFTPILADHLARLGAAPCAEARDGEILRPGCIHLAPGDQHLLVERSQTGLKARLSDAAPENFCRPSVDPMLRSATTAVSGRTLVVMLTGMGHDGLAGTRDVISAGGTAIAQDEETSVVWGMPGAIALAGLCHMILPLPALAKAVLNLLHAGRP